MLFKEIIAFYSENHKKPTLFGHNAELFIVKKDGTYSYHSALNGEVENWSHYAVSIRSICRFHLRLFWSRSPQQVT
jgi:hypothetical protein